MNKKLTWFDHLVGGAIAFVLSTMTLIVAAFFIKLVWPAVRFIATRAWALVRRQFAKSLRRPVIPKKNELPTPDIFKGAPNLAPAKQLKL